MTVNWPSPALPSLLHSYYRANRILIRLEVQQRVFAALRPFRGREVIERRPYLTRLHELGQGLAAGEQFEIRDPNAWSDGIVPFTPAMKNLVQRMAAEVKPLLNATHRPKVLILGPGLSRTDVIYGKYLLDATERYGELIVVDRMSSPSLQAAYRQLASDLRAPEGHTLQARLGREGDFSRLSDLGAQMALVLHPNPNHQGLLAIADTLSANLVPGGIALIQLDVALLEGGAAQQIFDQLTLAMGSAFDLVDQYEGERAVTPSSRTFPHPIRGFVFRLRTI